MISTPNLSPSPHQENFYSYYIALAAHFFKERVIIVSELLHISGLLSEQLNL